MRKILSLTFLFICVIGFAQKGSYIEIGTNMSRFAPFSQKYKSIDNLWSPQVSFNLKRPIVENILNIHYGVGFQRIGEKQDQVYLNYFIAGVFPRNSPDLYVNIDRTFYLHTMKVPVKLEYKLQNFHLLTGLYFSKNFDGEYFQQIYLRYGDHKTVGQQLKEYSELVEDEMLIPNNYSKILNGEWHYGFSLGIGYSINRWTLSASYEQGLSFIEHEGITANYKLSASFENYFSESFYDYRNEDKTRIKLRCLSFNIAYTLNQQSFVKGPAVKPQKIF